MTHKGGVDGTGPKRPQPIDAALELHKGEVSHARRRLPRARAHGEIVHSGFDEIDPTCSLTDCLVRALGTAAQRWPGQRQPPAVRNARRADWGVTPGPPRQRRAP